LIALSAGSLNVNILNVHYANFKSVMDYYYSVGNNFVNTLRVSKIWTNNMPDNSIITAFRDKDNCTLKCKHVRYNKTLNGTQRLNARDLMWLAGSLAPPGGLGKTLS
jgi:hypothetical protein